MRSYPFINELFKNILAKSQAIGGRFYICPQQGTEINTDDLKQVIQDLVKNERGKKYPLALLMPPVSYGTFTDKKGEWELYQFTMFFLTTTYASSTNGTLNINPNTRTSTHTIPETWHDMHRCSLNFIRVIDRLQRTKFLINSSFRLNQERDEMHRPITLIGNDGASGVRLDFRASLFVGCDLEDYDVDELDDIEIPDEDTHPVHAL